MSWSSSGFIKLNALHFLLSCVSMGCMTDVSWEQHLETLIDYCSMKNVMVVFKRGSNDRYEPDENVIYLNSQRTKENQVYLLLHELGHHQVLQDRILSEKFEPILSGPKWNLSHQVLQLEEEVMAWYFGEKTARILDITLGKKYQLLKSKCLKSYIRHLRAV